MTEDTIRMTPDVLRSTCKNNNGYSQPHLNDQLFLQCRGFTCIENLSPYTNIKVLWLEQNAIEKIEGLEHQHELVSLFLHNNAIRSMDGLNNLYKLRILNLSHNYISNICDGIATACPLLESLLISHNQIVSLGDCKELLKLKYLSTLDVSYNKIEFTPMQEERRLELEGKRGNDIARENNNNNNNINNNNQIEGENEDSVPVSDLSIVHFFKQMEALSVLYLQGNTLIHTLKNYRKNMVAMLRSLTYLDDRPVFTEERRATEAWYMGGPDAEAKERMLIRQEKTDFLKSCVSNLIKMSDANKEKKMERSREWEEEKKKIKEINADNNNEYKKKLNKTLVTITYDEEDSRLVISCEESGVWIDLVESFESLLRKLIYEENKRRKEEEEENLILASKEEIIIYENVPDNIMEAEVVAESEKHCVNSNCNVSNSNNNNTLNIINNINIGNGMSPSIDDNSEEMSYWLQQMELTDDETVQQMEEEMAALLHAMGPPVEENTVSNVSDERVMEKRIRCSDVVNNNNNNINNNNNNNTTASLTTLSVFSGKKVNEKDPHQHSHVRVWEEYEAWENSALRRFQK